jgi:hypothetical protein
MDDAKADGPPSTLLGAAQPESSKIPDSAFTKTQTPVKKQVASKPKSAAPDRKLAAANNDFVPGGVVRQAVRFRAKSARLLVSPKGHQIMRNRQSGGERLAPAKTPKVSHVRTSKCGLDLADGLASSKAYE